MAESRGHLLVVEDDENLRGALRDQLTAAGYEVMDTASPQVGLYHLGREKYTAVLLDLNLPAMDGHSFLRVSANATSRPPIILMSGTADAEDIAEAGRAGIAAFLKKPFSIQQAEEAIQKAIQTAP